MTRSADTRPEHVGAEDLAILRELERKVLWLASWTIHHANRGRLLSARVGPPPS
jgi:hypothetical protein